MPSRRHTIFYDGTCGLCTRSKAMLQRMDGDDVFDFVDLHDEQRMAPFPMVDRQAAKGQMFVLSPGGELAGEYDGLVSAAEGLAGWRSIVPLLRWAPVRALGWRGYRWVARNRYRLGGSVSCEDGACAINSAENRTGKPRPYENR
ncbi:MAG TPA: DCC1-like thiol-disulfide oxidoreductase family protein [Tepidisphaeraceae bacterium]|jgi:predicted DCC family thiol-disulfide oxidoreductase YuxK